MITMLRQRGIQPTPQRIAVANYVLKADSHPTAEQVLDEVRRTCPTVSRATVYNTLHLFVDRKLLREQVLKGGTVVFDSNVAAHHHFIDEDTGEVHDVPWEALKVTGAQTLDGFEVVDYQVIMRGRRRR